MTYEDQLRDAFKTRTRQLDARRPTFDAALPGGRADSGEPISLQADAPAHVRCAHGPLGHESARVVITDAQVSADPPGSAVADNTNADNAVPRFGARRWQLGLAVAAAAVGLLFVLLAVGDRSVDRVETGPDFATVPTAPVPTAPAPTPSSEPLGRTEVQLPVVVARGLGPATVVDIEGDVLFVVGDALPAGIAREVADHIEAELLSLPVLGEEAPERGEAIDDAGLVVQVGLDLVAQRRSSRAMEMVPVELDAVAVTIDQSTGEIVSAVSRSGSSLDTAQPAGSARIVTYTAAYELGFTAQSMINGRGPCEIQTDEGPEIINNFGDSPGGLILLSQQARRASRCAEARLEVLVGPSAVSNLMQSMMGTDIDGMIVDAPPVTAIEHVGAVAAITNGGKRPAIGFVSQVSSAEGDVVFERPGATQVVSVETANAVNALMQSNVERGTGVRAQLEDTLVGGFTGSVSDFQAAWFVGSASGLSTAVWVAHPDGEPMVGIYGRNVTGGSYPTELWGRIHDGFSAVRGPDTPPEAGFDPRDECPRGYPVALENEDDGDIVGCFRSPADDAFERRAPATLVTNESCPSSHPVSDDINGDGTNETCVTAGFTYEAPWAHYATSIEVVMQTGQVAADRYASVTTSRDGNFPGSLIYIGSALSGTEPVDLFRWRASDDGAVAFDRCFGTASSSGGTGICGQVDSPASGPSTGGSGPTRQNGVEIDPTHTYLLDNAPIGAQWLVIDTDLGARVIANVVGTASIAIWPSEAGGPQRISVLDADHVELWSFIPN